MRKLHKRCEKPWKYIVFNKPFKDFVAGVKYRIGAESNKSYIIGKRNLSVIKLLEGSNYSVGTILKER